MSLERFAAADAALKEGRTEESMQMIEIELERDPNAPVSLYRNFTSILFRHNEHARAERWTAAALKLYPKDYELWNVRGVTLRRLKRFDDAIKALRQAEKINPKNPSAISNRGNVHNDVRDGPSAVEAFTKLVRLQPTNHEFQRSLGRGHWYSGDYDKAMMRLNLAVKLKPDYVDAFLDIASVISEFRSFPEALPISDQALTVVPDSMRLCEARVITLRRSGRLRDAEAYLIQLQDRYNEEAWLHHQLGATISDYDRLRGNVHMERSVELDPGKFDYRLALIESLGRSRYGDEAQHLERAYLLLKEGMTADLDLNPSVMKVAMEIFVRVGDYEGVRQLGPFGEVGHKWAAAGRHTALFGLLGRVKSLDDARDLLAMHKHWGDSAIQRAQRTPIKRLESRPANGKIRIGFMSSDLRHHPVAYFALPLFTQYDREKYEVYCYSFYEGAREDPLQKEISDNVDVFRWRKDITDRDAAQMIADDHLDILIELGGSTHMNKLGVTAYKPAPLVASWLGYPHSAGPTTIDHIVLDPHLCPPDQSLLIEKPLLMPATWLALAPQIFNDRQAITDGLPEDRTGFITFGTANNPHKYSKEMLAAWARIVRDVPDSRFEFIRPEGNTPSFRRNMEAVFSEAGVNADRLVFRSVRGVHMQYYNEVDITLDPFPLTGGTSTCEALWMGVPVVNLRGQALFERLSGSILTNVGLAHHIADSPEQYHEIALKLAANQAERRELRANLRQRMKDSPLGQTEAFARDFYAMIEGAVRGGNTRKEALLEHAGT